MTQIFIDMKILSISNIDELAMSFNAKLKTTLRWRDKRITFKNLTPNGTFLSNSMLNKIWIPSMTFTNTKRYRRIKESDSVSAKVSQQGSPSLIDVSEIHEGNTFKGEEQDLSLFVQHRDDFQCKFDLSMYPFDTQKCAIRIKVTDDFRQFITLVPKKLYYSGMFYVNS